MAAGLTSTLDVYMNTSLAGRLSQAPGQRLAFRYDAGWLGDARALPLSVRLPLRDREFPEEESRPFFANLLPEGEVRRAICRAYRISEGNDFKLLEAIGGDCAGAVSFWPRGQVPAAQPAYEPLDMTRLAAWLADTRRHSLLTASRDARMSLAGAQEKLTVLVTGDKLRLPRGGAPSSHILKPTIAGLVGTVENEAFCMQLAGRVGLPVPAARVYAGPEPVYLVERFDRERDGQDGLQRVHQEDFCQALGRLPGQKYEAEGGPDLADCFALVQRVSAAPLPDRMALLRWVVFNYLIGNADAHAKNLALLIGPSGVRLAPFYDLLSTAVYPGLSRKMAMQIGGEYRPDWLRTRHWERLAAATGIQARLVARTCRQFAHDLPAAAAAQAGSGAPPIVTAIRESIARRSLHLERLFA